MRYFIMLIFFIMPLYGQAQKQGNIWYFGRNAGLDFNSGSPASLLDGQLNIREGCASIADTTGNLLFYTDGIQVWNKKHQLMPNGYDLMGNNSSTQSAIIVPYPDNPMLYYIFTVDFRVGPNGMRYSLVDMTLDGGRGDVTSKNISLLPNSTEKITAVHHKNNKDFWVIGHEWNSDAFYVWLINETGISDIPGIFHIGSIHSGSLDNSIGYLKASPNGSKIALAAYNQAKFVEVFDFDNATGAISNPLRLDGFSGSGPYGIEFSPNSKLLYVSEAVGPTSVYQYNLSLSNSTDIKNSKTVLGTSWNFGALQLATDGKIYLARDESLHLGVINSPDEVGIAADFKLSGLFLNGRKSRLGLPTFIQSFFLIPTFSYVDTCYGETTTFLSTVENPEAIIAWNFGNPASGDQNISNELNPSHTFSSPGTYTVTQTATVGGIPTSFSKEINIMAPPSFNLGSDTTLCEGEMLTLDIGHVAGTYRWSDSSSTASITVDTAGIYWAEVDDGVCTARDSISVSFMPSFSFTLGKDTTLCIGDQLLLQAPAGKDSYLWQDGTNSAEFNVDTTGLYWVRVEDYCNTFTDSIEVTVKSVAPPIIPDTLLCGVKSVGLQATGQGEWFQWYAGADDEDVLHQSADGLFVTPQLNTTTTFWVSAVDGNCQSERTMVTVEVDLSSVQAGEDTTIQVGESVQLQASGGENYLWLPAQWLSDPTISNPVSTPEQDITYTVEVTSPVGCIFQDHITIDVVDEMLTIPNTITPNGDGINDTWTITNLEKYTKNRVLIFDRTGRQLLKFDNYQQSWDGTVRGNPLPSDTYFYLIDKGNHTPVLKGSITIIR